MKIIFWYPIVFIWSLYICSKDTWLMSFPFGKTYAKSGRWVFQISIEYPARFCVILSQPSLF